MLLFICGKVGVIFMASFQLYFTPFNNFMRRHLFAIFLICLVAAIPGDGIEGCDGHESRFELMDQLPLLEASVPNGKKYTYGKLSLIQTTMAANSTLFP